MRRKQARLTRKRPAIIGQPMTAWNEEEPHLIFSYKHEPIRGMREDARSPFIYDNYDSRPNDLETGKRMYARLVARLSGCTASLANIEQLCPAPIIGYLLQTWPSIRPDRLFFD